MPNDIDVNILNLVQHVELTKVGWWDDVVQRLILATIWMDGKSDSMTVGSLIESIFSHFELHLGGKLDTAINLMVSTGDLIKLSDGSFKLSESSAKLLNSEIRDAEEIISKAKTVFVDTLAFDGLTSEEKDQIWIGFNDIFIRPFIKTIGANIYDLLNGKSANIDQSLLGAYLTNYPIEQRECLNNSARLFLNSKDLDVRSYILRFLNAYFCIEASGLDKSTLESLQISLVKPQDIILFVDTNFLFSILELHENPSNTAAIGLIELIKNLNGKIDVKLFVSNQTLQEARSVIIGTIDALNGTRLTPNMADAASRFVSGLSRKFFIEVNRSKTPLTPKEFFQPYVDNLTLILHRKGVEVFNEETSILNTRQDVVDDILEQSKYEEQKWGERAKAYKPLEHDVVLWHFVKDKRKVGIDSPLDAGYWIVTIDFRFLGFDEYKKSKGFNAVPICIHPTTLVQLLQFWIPRSQLLEDTLYSSLWLPFIFRDLDPQSENITIGIVKNLSRFENIGDLPKDTIVGVLVNEALRLKIKNEADVNKQIELVREALIDQNKKAQSEAEAAINKNIKYEQELQKKETDLTQLKGDLQTTREELNQEKINRQRLSEELSSIRTGLDNKEKADQIRLTKQKFVKFGFILPITLLIVVWVICVLFFKDAVKITGAISGISIFFWSWFFDVFGHRSPVISEIRIFQKYHSAIKWILTGLGIIMVGLITNGIYDLIKGLIMKLIPNP